MPTVLRLFENSFESFPISIYGRDAFFTVQHDNRVDQRRPDPPITQRDVYVAEDAEVSTCTPEVHPVHADVLNILLGNATLGHTTLSMGRNHKELVDGRLLPYSSLAAPSSATLGCAV